MDSGERLIRFAIYKFPIKKKIGTFWCLFFLLTPTVVNSKSLDKTNGLRSVKIAVLDTGEGNPHQTQVLNVLKSHLNCMSCQIKTFPIYDKNGNQMVSNVLEALSKAGGWADIINLSWNIKSTDKTKQIESKIKELSEQGLIIVGAGGDLGEDAIKRYQLSETVLGKASGLLVVGHIGKDGDIHFRSTKGPGFFAVDAPPKSYEGSSFVAPILTARLANILTSAKISRIELAKGLKQKRKELSALYPRLNALLLPFENLK